MRHHLLRFRTSLHHQRRNLSNAPTPKPTPPASPNTGISSPASAPTSPPSPGTTRLTALARLQSRLPPRLRPYLSPLLNAPLSHITSFLILHEITAILPLFGLFGLFHYSDAVWLERWRARIEERADFGEGVGKWGRYLRRKGWIADEDGDAQTGREVYAGRDTGAVTGGVEGRADELEGTLGGGREAHEGPGGKPARVVLELAAAWAVTKVLLPVRIAASVWATPWFARVAVVPIGSLARRIAGR